MNIKGITDFLFVTGQIAALIWVSLSYLIAAYATFILGEPFPVEELSGNAVNAIIGVTACKTLGNIFEHNEGGIFGRSTGKADDIELLGEDDNYEN